MNDKKKIDYYNSVSQQYVEMPIIYDCEGPDDIVYEKDGNIAISRESIVDLISTQSDEKGNYISVEYLKNGKRYILSSDNCSIINRCVADVFRGVEVEVLTDADDGGVGQAPADDGVLVGGHLTVGTGSDDAYEGEGQAQETLFHDSRTPGG